MEMRQLRYFMAVAQAGSYSAAATELSVAQPTLSIAVRNLEQELGVQLFYSFGRRQRLTDEGHRLLNGAQNMMEEYRRTIEDVRNTSSHLQGNLSIGLPPLLGTCYFASLIPEFSQQYPDIHIQLIEHGANVIDQMIVDGELDLALTLNRERTIRFETSPFTLQRIGVLINQENPLSASLNLRIEDLREQYFAIFNSEFAMHRLILDACQKAGYTPHIRLLSSQWDFLMEIVMQNRAITILPKPIYDKNPPKNIRWISLDNGPRILDVRLAWNQKRYMSNACKAFLEHVRNHRPPDDIG